MAKDSYSYSAIRVGAARGVATVIIDNPPVNIVDAPFVRDLQHFMKRAEKDESLKVIILESANQEFFAAHADFLWMFDPTELVALSDPEDDPALNPLQQLHERFRGLPQVTIAKLRGRLRAGGAELAMAADMRFAEADRTWLGQPETRMGIFPGGGGTQYLNRLIGRARALEVVLGADLYGTDLAEKYGWINRALPGTELDSYVAGLAQRIAELPDGVATAAMEAIDAAEASGPVPNLREEAQAHAKVYPSPPEVVERMRDTVKNGGQTMAGEIDLEMILDQAISAAAVTVE